MKRLYPWLILLVLSAYLLILSLKPSPLNLSGWIAYWDFNQGLDTLNKNKLNFSEINPFIYAFNDQGDIVCLLEKDRLAALREIKFDRLIPTITNDIINNSSKERILKDPGIIHKIFANSELLNYHINQILALVKQDNFDGIDIDYENLNPEDYDDFLNFLKELSRRMHNDKKQLVVTLEPKHVLKNNGLDLKLLSQHADRINIMCYNYSSNKTDPITPLFWIKEIIEKTKKVIPAAKISIAISIVNGRENEFSIVEKMNLIKKFKIKKIAIWRIGACDPKIIELLKN